MRIKIGGPDFIARLPGAVRRGFLSSLLAGAASAPAGGVGPCGAYPVGRAVMSNGIKTKMNPTTTELTQKNSNFNNNIYNEEERQEPMDTGLPREPRAGSRRV